MSRRSRGRSHLLQQAMVPSPPCSCSKAASYSCRGCGAPSSKPSLPSWPSHINEKERCLCPSHLQTPADEHRGCQLPSPSRPLFATHPVPAPPQSVFLAEAHPLEEPLERLYAQGLARHALQKAASVSDGGRRTLMDVLFEQSLDGFIRLGGLPPPFLGSRDSPRSAILAYRLTEERLTLNRRAAADLDVPTWRALTILRRRSSE